MEAEEAPMEEVKGEGAAPPLLTDASETGRKPERVQSLLTLSGIVGPVLFTVLVIILGFLRPGYSHVSQAISELGEVGAPNALVQDANFIILGVLTVAFALGLHRGIGEGKGSKTGPVLVAIFGGLGLAGVFPFDPAQPLDSRPSR